MSKNQQYIHVNPKEDGKYTIEWEPKDHECRVIPMPDKTTQLLVDIQTASPADFSYVFISPERLSHTKDRIQKGTWNTKCETVNNMMKNFSNLCRNAQIAKSSIHDLRRSAITNWAQRLPIQIVQQFAGHSDITTTRQYYLTVRPENIASASKIINQMLQEVKSGLTQKWRRVAAIFIFDKNFKNLDLLRKIKPFW
ncbi:MAG: site-specific integrase [Phycisphaerae bacterium]